jgi:uncharacterized membrane protein YsdA (DUF1294 family)
MIIGFVAGWYPLLSAFCFYMMHQPRLKIVKSVWRIREEFVRQVRTPIIAR